MTATKQGANMSIETVKKLYKQSQRSFKQRLSAWLQKDGNSYTWITGYYEWNNPSESTAVTYYFGKASRITAVTLSQWS